MDDWRDIKANKYGLKATTRFSITIQRSNEVAKMINIKTLLLPKDPGCIFPFIDFNRTSADCQKVGISADFFQ